MLLTDRVATLEGGKADKPDPVGLPTLAGSSVLTRDTSTLSQVAATYDTVSLLDITAATGSSAAKGSYAGKAMTGFGGLDITDAGTDGADALGSWLKYSHWGLITTKSGRVAASRQAVFSVGVPTGANPMPASAATDESDVDG